MIAVLDFCTYCSGFESSPRQPPTSESCKVTASESNNPHACCPTIKDDYSLAMLPAEKLMRSVSSVCHVLIFYGRNPDPIPGLLPRDEIIKTITDESAAVIAFGGNPFVRTRHGLRYRSVRDALESAPYGESHRDQCLATFSQVGLPLSTPIHLKDEILCIGDLLKESIANFRLDQAELEWTLLAYCNYLPPEHKWENRFGEKYSFDDIVELMLKWTLRSRSCAGTHVFHVLVKLDNADRRRAILSRSTRGKLQSYLRRTISTLRTTQKNGGYWEVDWEDGGISPENSTLESRLLITGHILEALSDAATEYKTLGRSELLAKQWLREILVGRSLLESSAIVCPLTHALKALRQP
jgi:hypothetical protein